MLLTWLVVSTWFWLLLSSWCTTALTCHTHLLLPYLDNINVLLDFFQPYKFNILMWLGPAQYHHDQFLPIFSLGIHPNSLAYQSLSLGLIRLNTRPLPYHLGTTRPSEYQHWNYFFLPHLSNFGPLCLSELNHLTPFICNN